jgi:hypothetical protein
MVIRCLAISMCAAGLMLAQTATTPAPAPGPGARGRGPNPNFGRGPGRGLDVFGPRAEERLTRQLGLDATQQNTLHTAILGAQVQRKGLNEKASSLQTQLATAVKAGNESAIEGISRDLSGLHEQETSIHAKTLSTLYNSLNATQKAKAEPMLNRELGVPGPRRGPGGRGPGGRGPAPAQQPAAVTPQ